jgi:hypothetical protein
MSSIDWFVYGESHQEYEVHFNVDKTFSVISVSDDDDKCLVELDFWPNLTPQNFHDKIKTYITFS